MKRIKFGLIIWGVMLLGVAKAQGNYTVTFNSDDGSSVESIKDVACGSTIDEPIAPTKECYTFDIWYSDSDLTIAWNFGTSTVTSDTTLYAKWNIVKYTVLFKDGDCDIDSKEVNCGDIISEPSDLKKDCYIFDVWYSDCDLTTAWNFGTSTVKSDTTLYAKRDIVKYTVLFKDGDSDIDSKEVNCGDIIPKPSDLKKDCYTFDVWYSDCDLTTAWDFETSTVTSDTMLYAKWNINTYTVTFNTNGGSEIDSQSIDCGAFVTEKPISIKTGYTLVDWYSDNETFENAWNFDNDRITSDTTLYAKWICAAAPSEIVRKDNSNILICKEVQNGKYQWGSFEKGKEDNAILPEEEEEYAQCCPYYQFNTIDTTQNVYFVDITCEGAPCSTRTYYPQSTSVSKQIETTQILPLPKLNIYPNPAKGHLSIALGAEITGKVIVSLRNLSGQTLLSKQIADYGNGEVLPFDLNFPSGIYLLVVQTNDEVLTSKILIE